MLILASLLLSPPDLLTG